MVMEGNCETSERRQALESNQSFKTRRAKWKVKGECCLVRISKRGLKLLSKLASKLFAQVTTQTRPPTFTTAVVISDAPDSSFNFCSLVGVVFFLDRDRRQKSKNMFALRSRSSPRQLPTWSPTFQVSRSPQLTIILQYS
jgi:hypothetical protein